MKKLSFIFIFAICLAGCDKDDSINSQLLGTWNLINFQCCKFPPEIFNTGRIIYSFTSNNNVEVQINQQLDNESQLPIQENGSYSYFTDGNKISIDNRIYDYRFEDDQLILSDSPESDGALIIFSKD